MNVHIQDDIGHAHCFVNSPEDEEGHACTQLQRQLDVEEVLGRNLLAPSATEVNYRVELNIDNPTAEEIKGMKVEIYEKDSTGTVTLKEAELQEDLTIKHTLEEKKEDEATIVEVRAKVYPTAYPENTGEGVSYLRVMLEDEKVVNARKDSESDTFINKIDVENPFYIRADTSIAEGSETIIGIDIINHNEEVLHNEEENTYVENSQVEHIFNLKEIFDKNDINTNDVKEVKGYIEWE